MDKTEPPPTVERSLPTSNLKGIFLVLAPETLGITTISVLRQQIIDLISWSECTAVVIDTKRVRQADYLGIMSLLLCQERLNLIRKPMVVDNIDNPLPDFENSINDIADARDLNVLNRQQPKT